MNKPTLPAHVDADFDEKFGNPNKVDSSSAFNKEHMGSLYPDLKQWFAQILSTEIAKAVEEERERIKNLPKMKIESVGLPTTQKAEQSNYDKKIRNQLRRMPLEEIL